VRDNGFRIQRFYAVFEIIFLFVILHFAQDDKDKKKSIVKYSFEDPFKGCAEFEGLVPLSMV